YIYSNLIAVDHGVTSVQQVVPQTAPRAVQPPAQQAPTLEMATEKTKIPRTPPLDAEPAAAPGQTQATEEAPAQTQAAVSTPPAAVAAPQPTAAVNAPAEKAAPEVVLSTSAATSPTAAGAPASASSAANTTAPAAGATEAAPTAAQPTSSTPAVPQATSADAVPAQTRATPEAAATPAAPSAEASSTAAATDSADSNTKQTEAKVMVAEASPAAQPEPQPAAAQPEAAPQPEPAPLPPAAPIKPADRVETWEKPRPNVRTAPLFELYGGYSFARFGGASNGTNFNGAMGSFGWNVKPWLQIVADTSYSFQSAGDTKNVIYGNHYGPRFFRRIHSRWGLTPFVEGLVGGSDEKTTVSGAGGYSASSGATLSFKAGGGLDMHPSRHWDIRLFDVDYYRTSFGVNSVQNNYWISTGVVLRLFGGRAE
ncbi:MAG: hypothetical protein WAN62_00425, partial [Candidatus Acidiferrum sp.]